jgi:uncharacterized protein with GYD domain
MAKFLAKAKYTAPDGVKGLIADGGTARLEAVKALLASVGGTVESFYFAIGEVDAYTVVDVPDSVSATAVSLAVNASGLATVELVALLTPQEVDAAARKLPQYDAPGPQV